MIEIMQSIRPNWCELIISGIKTIEARKTRPKCDTPFKVDIYCTQDFKSSRTRARNHRLWIGEPINKDSGGRYIGNGKVIGEYICDEIYTYNYLDDGEYDILYRFPDHYEKSCLNPDDLLTYGDGKTLYGWHISDLKIYDTPKELSEFETRKVDGAWATWRKAERAPQSWCYVHRID